MILVLGLMAGVATSLLRSAVSVILVAALIFACFLVAALMGPVRIMDLVWAILGYNAGISLTFLAMLILAGGKTRTR